MAVYTFGKGFDRYDFFATRSIFGNEGQSEDLIWSRHSHLNNNSALIKSLRLQITAPAARVDNFPRAGIF